MLVVLSVVTVTYAQNANVRGYVYDSDTGEPILYGNVILEGTTIGTTTDFNGFYNLSGLEAGTYKLQATYLGYDTATVEIVLRENSILNKSLYIKESGVNLGTINISAQKTENRTEVKVSQIRVSPKQIKALPSVGGDADIAQYLQVLPGIISTGDQGGQLYIRGGAPVQNKILLDGLNIYNPFHSLGFYSVFETELIRNVDILTGAFNAEHGGRISAVVDINTRDGDRKEFGGHISASPFMGKVLLEGPLKKFKEGGGSSSFVFTGKKSFIENTSKQIYSYAADDPDVGLPFSFTDLYGKFSFQAPSGSKVSIFGFNFEDRYNNPSVADIGWENVGVGANFSLIPSSSSIIIDGTVGVTNYNIGITEGDENNRNSDIREFGANLDFTFFGEQSEFKYGFELKAIRTNFDFINPFGLRLDQIQNTTETSGYFKYRHNFGKLIIEPSVRLMYYASQSTFSPEPRFGLKYNVNDNVRIKAAAGMYSQNILSTSNDRDVVNLFSGFLTGPEEQVRGLDGQFLENKLLLSNHAVAGVEYDLTENLMINVEGYIKDYPQLIVVNRNKLSAQDPDYSQETGEAYGIDVSAKYELPRLYVWATYSHGYVNRFDGDQIFPTVFDRRHNVNFLTTYDLDRDGDFQISFRWNLGSGFPFTKTAGFYNYNDFLQGVNTDVNTANPDQIGVIFSEERNGGRLPYYHRLDLSITKKFQISKRFRAEANASVTNAYDRENIFYFDRIRYNRVDQLPILPSAGLKLFF